MLEQTTITREKDLGSQPAAGRKLRLPKQAGWWGLLFVGVLFGAYALGMGGHELLAQLDLAGGAPVRAAPLAFIIHALTGGLVLIVGPLQFNDRLRARNRQLHRLFGRIYVGSVWLASLAGLWSAVFFDKGLVARLLFILVAILWFVATTVAFLRARQRQFRAHRAWMIRSFALSLFFVTFPLWTELLVNTPLPSAVGYPLGLFLGWSLNLAAAEWWLRHRKPKGRAAGAMEQTN